MGNSRGGSTTAVAVLGAACWLTSPVPAFAQAPEAKMIVGSRACPELNAQDRTACRFSRSDHGFQIWPGRISVQTTPDRRVWLVTSTGHRDGIFDHTLTGRQDDHVAFQCFVSKDGQYYGPIGFRIHRGAVWATYGEGIVTAASVTSGPVAAYFSSGGGGAAGAAAGGPPARALREVLTEKFGKKGWEVQAGNVAHDICRALAR